MLRPYIPADEDNLIRVWLASTIPGQSFLPEEHWRSLEPMIREKFMPIADTFVVEEDGELLAFMSLLDNLIGGLFTDPAHQGQGHGRTLVEHGRTLHDPLLVEVFLANTAALGFYRSCGFVDHEAKVDEMTGLPVLWLTVPGLRAEAQSGEKAADGPGPPTL